MIHNDRYSGDAGQVVLLGILILFLIAFLIVWPSVYGGCMAKIAEMKAFKEKTKEVFETVVIRTQDLEIKAVKEIAKLENPNLLNLGELAYQDLSKVTSERLKELRGQINEYNTRLEIYKSYNEYFFARGFLPEVPKEFELIGI